MSKVNINIDGVTLQAEAGISVLRAALDNNIYIPNLCHLVEDKDPAASCRVCFVEIEGKKAPVTACTEKVAEGMVVDTRGEAARKLAASGFSLLMAAHHLDCAHCPANHNCELQEIARHLGAKLKPKGLRLLKPEKAVDDSHPDYRYDPNMCVLCGRCVRTCERCPAAGTIGFSGRGFKRVVSTFNGAPLAEVAGPEFAACVKACPTGALSFTKAGK